MSECEDFTSVFGNISLDVLKLIDCICNDATIAIALVNKGRLVL